MPYLWETLQGRETQMLNPNTGLNSKFTADLCNAILLQLEAKQIHLKTLADFADVGVNTPSNLLRKRNCELKNLIKICDVLNIKLDFKMLK